MQCRSVMHLPDSMRLFGQQRCRHGSRVQPDRGILQYCRKSPVHLWSGLSNIWLAHGLRHEIPKLVPCVPSCSLKSALGFGCVRDWCPFRELQTPNDVLLMVKLKVRMLKTRRLICRSHESVLSAFCAQTNWCVDAVPKFLYTYVIFFPATTPTTYYKCSNSDKWPRLCSSSFMSFCVCAFVWVLFVLYARFQFRCCWCCCCCWCARDCITTLTDINTISDIFCNVSFSRNDTLRDTLWKIHRQRIRNTIATRWHERSNFWRRQRRRCCTIFVRSFAGTLHAMRA